MSKFNNNLLNMSLRKRRDGFQTLNDVVEGGFLRIRVSSKTVLQQQTETPRRDLGKGSESSLVEGEIDDLGDDASLELGITTSRSVCGGSGSDDGTLGVEEMSEETVRIEEDTIIVTIFFLFFFRVC